MASFTRANAWNNDGTFDNTDLLWYAKAVGVMQSRQLDDQHSWWFFAAMHGEYVTPDSVAAAAGQGVLLWKDIPAPPTVPVTPLPNKSVSDSFWNQCQHQSWFFLPWHRGYLLALEAHIRAAVIALDGPSTWALPYWNYFGPGDQFKIPPAFTQASLPDGSPNPLLVDARYGPDQDRNIYIPTRSVISQNPGDQNFSQGPVTDDQMTNDLFTGSDASTKLPGFGGPATSFSNSGDTNGNLEGDPHNKVHVYVGKNLPDGPEGLMSDPGVAAMDPIFYLHHANIDRMWAVWNVSNKNTADPAWLSGPTANGDRTFVVPMPDGTSWTFTPADVNSLSQVNYTYDDLPAAPAMVAVHLAPLAARFERLGAPDVAAKIKKGARVKMGTKTELVGASSTSLSLSRTGAATDVRLDSGVRRKISANFAMVKAAAADTITSPDRIYLNLEGVRGTSNSPVLSVYVNLPEGAKPSDHPELLAGSVGLFGLRNASQKDSKHGGKGMTYMLDITPIVDRLHLSHALDVDSLHVRIVPDKPLPERSPITIGRISLYREGQ